MTLERVEWADVQQSGDPMLRLSNGRECEMAGWYSSAAVIIDAPGGRSTATLGAPAEARKLLEEIARRRLPTRIAGNRRNRSAPTKVDGKVWCSVEMVWAVNLPSCRNSSIAFALTLAYRRGVVCSDAVGQRLHFRFCKCPRASPLAARISGGQSLSFEIRSSFGRGGRIRTRDPLRPSNQDSFHSLYLLLEFSTTSGVCFRSADIP